MSSGPNPATPEGYNAQVLSELREQTRMLKSIDGKLDVLTSHLGANASAKSNGATEQKSSGGVVPADDRDLDSQYGNPQVRKDPSAKYWDGESFAGMQYSECPPDYLNALAKWLEATAFMKRKNPKDEKDEKYAYFAEKDAARAKGWAIRNKDMLQEMKRVDDYEASGGDAADDSCPF